MDYNQAIERIGEVIDAAGVAVIVIGMLISAGAAAARLGHRETGTYRRFRRQLGRTILLGLELLVAGDIVRTVAAEPTLTSVAMLAIIVFIRTLPELLARGRAGRPLATAKRHRLATSGIVRRSDCR